MWGCISPWPLALYQMIGLRHCPDLTTAAHSSSGSLLDASTTRNILFMCQDGLRTWQDVCFVSDWCGLLLRMTMSAFFIGCSACVKWTCDVVHLCHVFLSSCYLQEIISSDCFHWRFSYKIRGEADIFLKVFKFNNNDWGAILKGNDQLTESRV